MVGWMGSVGVERGVERVRVFRVGRPPGQAAHLIHTRASMASEDAIRDVAEDPDADERTVVQLYMSGAMQFINGWLARDSNSIVSTAEFEEGTRFDSARTIKGRDELIRDARAAGWNVSDSGVSSYGETVYENSLMIEPPPDGAVARRWWVLRHRRVLWQKLLNIVLGLACVAACFWVLPRITGSDLDVFGLGGLAPSWALTWLATAQTAWRVASWTQFSGLFQLLSVGRWAAGLLPFELGSASGWFAPGRLVDLIQSML